MDNKYKKLTFKEKIATARGYRRTKKGFNLGLTLNRLVLWGLLSFGCAISFFLFSFDFDDKLSKICLWILTGFMTVAGLIFLIWQHRIRVTEYNKYLEASEAKKN